MKKVALVLALSLLAAGLFAAEPITASAKAPTIDGTVDGGEYAWTKAYGKVALSFTLGADGLAYYAISAPTAGWVALGYGSDRMNNALIAMAYDDGKAPFFTEQKGKGHGHVDSDAPVVKKWAVKTVNGVTTLEISFESAPASSGNQIKLIWAYGGDTNIKSFHRGRGSVVFDVKS